MDRYQKNNPKLDQNFGLVIDCDREKYTVNTGDTLESISSKYKVPEDAIIFSNGLLENKVKAGMQLVISLCYPTPTP